MNSFVKQNSQKNFEVDETFLIIAFVSFGWYLVVYLLVFYNFH